MNKQLEIPSQLLEIIGQSCCRKYIGEWNSLSIGFGKRVISSGKVVPFYGEYEIGTYFANWEITQYGKVLLNKTSGNTSIELQKQLDLIDLCCITKIELGHANTCVNFIFTQDLRVCFYPRDEIGMQDSIVVHAFLPNKKYAEFHPASGWKLEILK